jgi:hypothetical protein
MGEVFLPSSLRGGVENTTLITLSKGISITDYFNPQLILGFVFYGLEGVSGQV